MDGTRIAVPCAGDADMKAEVSPHFGRCDSYAIVTLEEGKTKKAKALLEKMGASVGTLVIVKGREVNLSRAFANLPKVKLIPVRSINIYELLNYEKVIIARDAIGAIVEGLS